VLELFADGPHQNRAHERLRGKENIEQETPNCNMSVIKLNFQFVGSRQIVW
jgi:hypothetical protein